MMADDEETLPDPGQEFARLMSGAAAAAAPTVDPEAPYGWTTDADGNRRPKKTAGRPRKSPSADELKAGAETRAAEQPGESPAEDRAPARPGRGRKRLPAGAAAEDGAVVPQHRPGVITKGMNKRYRQLGKLIRPLDKDTGQALIGMTENTSEEPDEDTSVGACWDELARVNPRVRKFCLAVIQGGAYGALVMAHAPLGVAVALKFVSANPGFIGRLILSMSEPDEDTPEGEGGLPFGMTAEDAAQMMKMAEKLIPGEVIREAAEASAGAAAGAQNGASPPRRPPSQFARHGQGKRR
jgi:hypothetical protein